MQHSVPSPRLLLVRVGLLLAAAIAIASPDLNATEFIWTGGGSNNNWGNAANWDRGVPLPNDGTADVGFLNAGSFTSPNVETPYSINSVSFDRLAGAYTIAGAQITLGAGGLTQNALAAQTIQNAIAVATNQTWRFGTDAGLLTLSGGVNLGTTSRTLTLDSAGANFLSAVFTGTNGKLVKTGGGTLTYSGVGSSIPLGEVNGGTLVVGPGASFSTTNFTVNAGGTLSVKGTITSPNSYFVVNGTAASAAAATLAAGGSLTTSYTGISNNGSFTQSGGTHTVGSLVLEGGATSPGSYALSGGTLAATNSEVGYSSSGSFTQTGGTFTSTTLTLGTIANGGNGNYTLSGSSQLTTTDTFVGKAGTGAFTQSGGTHQTATLTIGNTANTGSGNYTLSGTGQLTTTNTLIGSTGSGTFTQTGGTHTVTQNLFVGQNGGSGTYTLSGGLVEAQQTFVVGNPAVFNLDGGTLRTSLVTLGPNPTFNFNGGTLQATADAAEFVRFPGNVIVRSGGAVIDSNGHTVGLRTILKHDSALGATADGGLTKTGAGTLILTGAGYSGETTGNTYTGATKVNAGTLLVNNTHGSGTGSGNVTVNSTGTLGGTGTISGSVAVESGGTLAPGASVGTLRTGSLSLVSGGAFLFELDPASATADRIDVTGAVSLGGGDIVLSLLSAPTLGQAFDILHNDGSDLTTGTFAQGATVAGIFNGSTYVFAINYTANNDGGAIGNDLSLVTVVVPEPSTYALALLGVGVLAGCRYSRRRYRF